MASLLKNIIVLVGLVGLAAIGYYLFVLNRGATIDAGSVASVQAEVETQVILRRLADLQSIQISTELFSDPKFQSLTDFSTTVNQVPVGRPDPFDKPTE